MKKSIIAAGAASVALAAMPIVGVFAEEHEVTNATVADTITLSIGNTCSVTADGTLSNSTISNTIDFGSKVTNASYNEDGTDMTINCNVAWTMVAKAAGTVENHTRDLATSDGSNVISGTSDASGSYWQFKLTDSASSVTSTYLDYNFIPDATTGATVVAGGAAVTDELITPNYRITLAGNQAGGDYTGGISYTLASTAN